MIIELLKARGAEVHVYDSHVPKYSDVKSLGELFTICKNIIVATAHEEIKRYPLDRIAECGVMNIIDGRNCLDKEKARRYGIYYKGIGR